MFQASLSGGSNPLVFLHTVGFGSTLIPLPANAPGFADDEGNPCRNIISSDHILYVGDTVALSGFIGTMPGCPHAAISRGPNLNDLNLVVQADQFSTRPECPECVSASFDLAALSDSGAVLFYGRFRDMYYNIRERGIFTAKDPGASSEIALVGGNAPDTDTAVFSSFDKLVINTRGDVAFVGYLEIGIGDVTSSNYMGIWRYTSADDTLRLVVRMDTEAPGTGGLLRFARFFDIAISPTGDVAFLGRVTAGSVPNALWRGTTPSDIEIVAGGTDGFEPTPTSLEIDESFLGISAPVFTEAGDLIFNARGWFVRHAIWRDSGGPIEPIVKGWTYVEDGPDIPGDVAPGTGGNFASFGGFSVNGSGMLAFFADYSVSGQYTTNSLWGQDSNGVFHYIVQPGDVLETHYGPQAIYRLGFLAAPGNVSGLGSGFSDGFEVAFEALFENTSEGIFRANIGDVPPPGHVYIWSGEAGGNNWHADVDGETSWNDGRGSTVYPPGNEGLAVVTIEDNVPPGGVVLDERPVAIKSLTATGGITVAQPLALAEDSRIESLVIDAGLAVNPMGDELVICEGEVTLTGNSEWREGWINTNQGNVKNSGTLTIDGSIIPRALDPAASQRRPTDPPRKLTGTFKNVANATTSQKDNVELDRGTIENEADATWELIKGDITCVPGGGGFYNNGLLIKPEGSDTADSNVDALLGAGNGSRIEVNAQKLILRGGAEFSGTNEIALNMSHGTTPNAAAVSELTLTRTGAIETTYRITSGKTTVSAPWPPSSEADGAVCLTHGVAALTDRVVRLTDGVVLSVLNGTELALRDVWLAVEGGKIVAPGILTSRGGGIIWSGGTIGLPDLGPGSANLVLDLTYLTMPAGAPRTLAGTLTLSNGADALQEADLTLAGGKVVVEGECVWKIAAEVTVSATPGGKFILEPLPRVRGRLTIDVDSQVTFSAPLDNPWRS